MTTLDHRKEGTYETYSCHGGSGDDCTCPVAADSSGARQPDNKVIPFTAIEISCSETPGTETTEGDITRHRGQLEAVVWFSEEPLANARLHQVIDWNYYASSDQGDYTGTHIMEPVGMAGASKAASAATGMPTRARFLASSSAPAS